jgi:tetratricopeptide (TPR) repeat protein
MRRALENVGIRWAAATLLVGALALACPRMVPATRAQASGLENGPAPPPDEPAAASSSSSSSSPGGSSSGSSAGTPGGAAAPPTGAASPAPPAETPTSEEAKAATPEGPTWDPLHASKNLEVGLFYMKKGDWDAALDRFQDAARLQPGLAKPFELLGEVYEKKDQPADAVTAYRKYLELYDTAPDRERIRKRIEKLEGKRPRTAI